MKLLILKPLWIKHIVNIKGTVYLSPFIIYEYTIDPLPKQAEIKHINIINKRKLILTIFSIDVRTKLLNKDDIKKKVDALKEASMKIGEEIYKEAQKEAQKQQAKQGKGNPPKGKQENEGKDSCKKKEKVVDAEFEEVDKKNNKKSA